MSRKARSRVKTMIFLESESELLGKKQKLLSTILWTSRKQIIPALHKAFKLYDGFFS
ncbi:unnamed protein product [Oikopleura dioica]|uniref:Uncharacterized protein n=1 Tax=Oikopleura dioica TaxID=34765 RepID=E4Y361_OIKDI|nr:unnamed protein product [Oikopleura dioica]